MQLYYPGLQFFQKYNKPVISHVSVSRSECIFTKCGQKYNSEIQVIHPSGFLCCTYPVHRPRPSTRWDIYTVRWSCCRKLRSDTGSAADTPPHKTQQGILGEKRIDKTMFRAFERLPYRLRLRSAPWPLTLCAVGPGPAHRASTASSGRMTDAFVTAATGLVTSFPIGTGRACCQERDKHYHHHDMSSADQKCASSDVGQSKGNTKSVLCRVCVCVSGPGFPKQL